MIRKVPSTAEMKNNALKTEGRGLLFQFRLRNGVWEVETQPEKLRISYQSWIEAIIPVTDNSLSKTDLESDHTVETSSKETAPTQEE